MRHPPRGVAASGFPPLCNIPHCCLPQESGPCLSSSVADRPLRPATRHCLGKPLPYQLADRRQAHLIAINLSPVGNIRYQQSFPIVVPDYEAGNLSITHPCATNPPSKLGFIVRLACVKHAASVHSEPGSNSPLKYNNLRYNPTIIIYGV